MRRGIGGIILIGVVLLTACGRTHPQRPTFQGQSTIDTSAVQMLTFNQHMAAQADMQLAQLVDENYVLMDENYWVKGLRQTEQGALCLQEGDYVELEAHFYSLNDSLLTTHKATVQIGQVDDIQAIGYVLPLMQRGEKVTLLVPWYMAFGSAGNQQILPYENIRVELEVN